MLSYIFRDDSVPAFIDMSIVYNFNFVKMPLSTQMLYLHLVMRADIDGKVNWPVVFKYLGGVPDDIYLLERRGFIKNVNKDTAVITHYDLHTAKKQGSECNG